MVCKRACVVAVEAILELPAFKLGDLDKYGELLRGRGLGAYVPENPAGLPSVLSVAAGAYLRRVYGLDVYASARVRDSNLLHLYTIALTAKEFGLRGLAILRGDPPSVGGDANDMRSEDVLAFLRPRAGQLRLGLVVSLRYSIEDIKKRLSHRPDFVLAIHFGPGRLEKLESVSREAKRLDVAIYVFLLLGFKENVGLFERLRQPYVPPEDLRGLCKDIYRFVDGVVLSSPMALRKAVESASELASC